MAKELNINKEDYSGILKQAVAEIHSARSVAAKQIASAANAVYWSLGKLLFEKQLSEGYGSGVVNQLSVDLKKEFPDMGLSPRNLWNMKLFYERYYQADQKLLQAVAVFPWGHNLLLIDKVQSLEAVKFYATNIDVYFRDETLWLSQKAIAALFEKGRSTITEHLKKIFEEGELDEKVVCRNFRHTTQHGAIEGKYRVIQDRTYESDFDKGKKLMPPKNKK